MFSSVHTVTMVCTVAGGVVAVIAATWKFSRDISDGNGRIHARIDKAEEIARRETDEAEESTRENYRGKEVCDERHQTLTASVNEIKNDVKSLLKKNGIHSD